MMLDNHIAPDAISISDSRTCHKSWFGQAAVVQPAGASSSLSSDFARMFALGVTIGIFFFFRD